MAQNIAQLMTAVQALATRHQPEPIAGPSGTQDFQTRPGDIQQEARSNCNSRDSPAPSLDSPYFYYRPRYCQILLDLTTLLRVVLNTSAGNRILLISSERMLFSSQPSVRTCATFSVALWGRQANSCSDDTPVKPPTRTPLGTT